MDSQADLLVLQRCVLRGSRTDTACLKCKNVLLRSRQNGESSLYQVRSAEVTCLKDPRIDTCDYSASF